VYSDESLPGERNNPMKRQLAIWLCLCLLLVRCTSNGPTELGAKPANLVDEDKMADILAEVHLSEARISKMAIGSADTSAILFKRLHTNTLKKFGVDTASYTQSFVYYSARPGKLAKIYEQVLDKLKAIEKEKAATSSKTKPTATP
jgi:DNA-directed RNA polymerase